MAEVDKSLPGDQPLPLDFMEGLDESLAQMHRGEGRVLRRASPESDGEKYLTEKTLPQLSSNVFKFKYTQREWGEYTVRLFVGPDDDHLQFAGSFTLKQSEMDELSLNLGILIGARSQLGLDVTKWWLEESNG